MEFKIMKIFVVIRLVIFKATADDDDTMTILDSDEHVGEILLRSRTITIRKSVATNHSLSCRDVLKRIFRACSYIGSGTFLFRFLLGFCFSKISLKK